MNDDTLAEADIFNEQQEIWKEFWFPLLTSRESMVNWDCKLNLNQLPKMTATDKFESLTEKRHAILAQIDDIETFGSEDERATLPALYDQARALLKEVEQAEEAAAYDDGEEIDLSELDDIADGDDDEDEETGYTPTVFDEETFVSDYVSGYQRENRGYGENDFED